MSLCRFKYRFVLNLAGQDVRSIIPGKTSQDGIVGFTAARGEHDFGRSDAKQIRHVHAGFFQRVTRRASCCMHRRRIPEF